MLSPAELPERGGSLIGLSIFLTIVLAGLGAISSKVWLGAESPVLASGTTLGLERQPYTNKPEPDHVRGKLKSNPTYPDAPAPGSSYFRTLSFADLADKVNGSPGTMAARDLLVRTNRGSVAAAEAQYDGSGRQSFDEYKRAVFLNTVAVIHERDARLLENARLVRFYDGKKEHGFEYGIVLSGVTPDKLGRANMRPAGFLGTSGRRSPKDDTVASLEASWMNDDQNTFAFDVDLYNPKADPVKHTAEVKFNDNARAATHPADVARALLMRGIFSGVITE